MRVNIGGTRRFHLSDEARDYFELWKEIKEIQNPECFQLYVEPYYLCLLMD